MVIFVVWLIKSGNKNTYLMPYIKILYFSCILYFQHNVGNHVLFDSLNLYNTTIYVLFILADYAKNVYCFFSNKIFRGNLLKCCAKIFLFYFAQIKMTWHFISICKCHLLYINCDNIFFKF